MAVIFALAMLDLRLDLGSISDWLMREIVSSPVMKA